jgi:hypothetical protein
MRLMINRRKGLAAVPVIIAFAVVILIIGYAWFKQNVEPITSPKPPVRVSTAGGPALKWSDQVPAGRFLTQAVDLEPGQDFDLTVTSPGPGTQVVVRGADGQIMTTGFNSRLASSLTAGADGQTTAHYHLGQAAAGSSWQVEVDNSAGTGPATYELVVPDAGSAINSSNNTSGLAPTGQGINISITLQETLNGQIQPVTGATVTALITSPSGLLYTLPLAESSSAPGTYYGYFTGNQEAGVYQITYQISGLDHNGQPFTQETDAQFLSTGLPPEATPGSDGWVKIFDINLSGSIQLIGY